MKEHVCRKCGAVYKYCRGCLIKPIPWKAAGFCSKECSAEFKEVIQKDVEVVINDKDASTSEEENVEYPYFFTQIEEENKIDEN
jgi:hypothetical protein